MTVVGWGYNMVLPLLSGEIIGPENAEGRNSKSELRSREKLMTP